MSSIDSIRSDLSFHVHHELLQPFASRHMGSGPRRAAVGRVLLVLGRAEFRDLLCTAMHDSNTKSAALTEEPNREQIVDLGAECRTGLS